MLVRRRALTRLALLAAATTALLVFVLVQLLHPLHDWLRSAAAHAAVRARSAVDDAPWAACRVRTDPFVQWRADRRPAVVVLANCELGNATLSFRCGGDGGGGGEEDEDTGRTHFDMSHHVLSPTHHVYRFEAHKPPAPDGGEAAVCSYEVFAGDGRPATPVHSVRLPDLGVAAASVRVSVTGDSQGGPITFLQLLEELDERRPDVNVLLGDVVQNGWDARQWVTDFLGPLASANDFGARIPSIVARGNHDVGGHHALHGFFGGPPAYGAFALGPAHLIVLDSNTDAARLQSEWLEAELAGAAAQAAAFRIVLVHVPPFVEYWDPAAWARGEDRWGVWVREQWAPLFEGFGVDLVLSGHQHNYQRGERNGTHYVVLGGAGGELDRERVADHGVYSVTLLEHHAGVLDLANGPDQDLDQDQGEDRHGLGDRVDRAAPLRPRLTWTVLSPLGVVLDTLVLAPRRVPVQ